LTLSVLFHVTPAKSGAVLTRFIQSADTLATVGLSSLIRNVVMPDVRPTAQRTSETSASRE
jgi:hypothetical protein